MGMGCLITYYGDWTEALDPIPSQPWNPAPLIKVHWDWVDGMEVMPMGTPRAQGRIRYQQVIYPRKHMSPIEVIQRLPSGHLPDHFKITWEMPVLCTFGPGQGPDTMGLLLLTYNTQSNEMERVTFYGESDGGIYLGSPWPMDGLNNATRIRDSGLENFGHAHLFKSDDSSHDVEGPSMDAPLEFLGEVNPEWLLQLARLRLALAKGLYDYDVPLEVMQLIGSKIEDAVGDRSLQSDEGGEEAEEGLFTRVRSSLRSSLGKWAGYSGGGKKKRISTKRRKSKRRKSKRRKSTKRRRSKRRKSKRRKSTKRRKSHKK
jgi:hypothetical protein